LIKAFNLGCRFDGWSDHFDYNLWQKACHAAEVNIDSYSESRWDLPVPLPWDHIDTGVSKEYLRNDYRKALAGELTDDCRFKDCNQCGVCDFEKIAPVIYSRCETESAENPQPPEHDHPVFRKLILTFSKTGPARFLGHLEMASIFVRAFRRSRVQLKYSEGFHPKPKLNFLDALPVGMESIKEFLVIIVSEDLSSVEIVSRLNSNLPEGLQVINISGLTKDASRFEAFTTTYRVLSNKAVFHQNQMIFTMERPEWITTKTSRKGKSRKLNLRPAVLHLERRSDSELKMTLQTSPERVVRPKEIVAYLFDISSDDLKQLRIIKVDNRIES
jgi:radical SAM-linked protein